LVLRLGEIMRQIIALTIGILLLSGGVIVAQTIEATTPDGKTVILSPDGTWKYKEKSTSTSTGADFVKPPEAKDVLKSSKGFVELWFDSTKWKPTASSDNPSAEFSLTHSSGDAYAMAIIERISMPISTLKGIALENAKKVAPDAKVTFEEERIVNGVKVVAMRIEGTIQGIPFTYYGYYWTGKAGSLQVITYTGQNLFNEFESDFTKLLNGVVITKPE
jgi:hypothetical protein